MQQAVDLPSPPESTRSATSASVHRAGSPLNYFSYHASNYLSMCFYAQTNPVDLPPDAHKSRRTYTDITGILGCKTTPTLSHTCEDHPECGTRMPTHQTPSSCIMHRINPSRLDSTISEKHLNKLQQNGTCPLGGPRKKLRAIHNIHISYSWNNILKAVVLALAW